MTLKNVPSSFRIDSEEEVRFAVALYFRDLGFNLDELSFEDHFSIQLGHNSFQIKNGYRASKENLELAHGYSDLLLMRAGIPLAVVEIKRTDHVLHENDAWQAISYARLLKRRVAPYAIVTNGVDTKVYGTLADSDDLIELTEPANAIWYKKGQSLTSINEDIRFKAAKKLVGINPTTLQLFCKEQIRLEIEDLKGTVNENKLYVPNLYLEREAVSASFNEWLTTEFPCFAIVGESGLGKTNFMCAMAESLVNGNFVLFYSAKNLIHGLVDAIVNDFVWEFKNERAIAHIAARVNEIAESHGKAFIIFVDAIDEFMGDLSRLKAEIRDFLQRIDDSSIRLCISCKSHDWKTFVIDHPQTFNRIARLTFPQSPMVLHPTKEEISALDVGFWLDTFTESELSEVFEKYRTVYMLRGNLNGDARIGCQIPLNLRLLAEAYREGTTELPSELARSEFFSLFWRQKLSSFGSEREALVAEGIVCSLAEDMVTTDVSELNESGLLQKPSNDLVASLVYEDVIRFGLLNRITRNEETYIKFPFEKLRSFVYVVKARRLHVLTDSTSLATEVQRIIRTRLGRDALLFCLAEMDLDLLIRLATVDINLFFQVMTYVEQVESEGLFSVDLTGITSYDALKERGKRFIRAYSAIRNQFPNLKRQILPYTDGNAGLWVYEHFHGFRTMSSRIPDEMILLNEQQAQEVFTDQLSITTYRDLLPVDEFYSGGLLEALAVRLPEKLASEEFCEQLASLVAGRLLNVSDCPVILSECVADILITNAPVYSEETPRGPCWQWLGYMSKEDAFNSGL